MFIQRLTYEDFQEFTKEFNLEIDKILRLRNQQYRIDLISIESNSTVSFYVSDFSLKVEKYYKLYADQIEAKWLKFMQNKFGNDYKIAYNEYHVKNNNINNELVK